MYFSILGASIDLVIIITMFPIIDLSLIHVIAFRSQIFFSFDSCILILESHFEGRR